MMAKPKPNKKLIKAYLLILLKELKTRPQTQKPN